MARFTHDFVGVRSVVWDNEFHGGEMEMKGKYGEGPFTVVQVVPVPTRLCNCHTEEDDFYLVPDDDHRPGCPAFQPNTVGHDQWVEIEVGGNVTLFSGAYFVPAPE